MEKRLRRLDECYVKRSGALERDVWIRVYQGVYERGGGLTENVLERLKRLFGRILRVDLSTEA